MKYIWNQCDRFDNWYDDLSLSKQVTAFAIMIGIPLYGIAGIFLFKNIIVGGLLCNSMLIHCGITFLLAINKERKK